MHIKKILVDGTEYLPHIADTPLMEKWESGSALDRNKAMLYNALVERENYFQDHSVVAFGNLDYARCEGVVTGICLVLNLEEDYTDETIIFRKNGKKFLVVDRLNKPERYFDEKRELKDILENL